MRIDPYLIKRLPKVHHKRLLYTLWARSAERYSRYFFQEYELPEQILPCLPAAPNATWEETQVTPEQARYLLWALQHTNELTGCVVEVGSWRGVTTAYLANSTGATVVAIDPWIGDKNEVNWRSFLSRTASCSNVVCQRKPFGQAVREWTHGPVRFIFIDAAHDYANVAHDLAAVRRLVMPGGIVALHDTDNPQFSGCRRAVYEAAECFELAAHIPNLVLLRVPNADRELNSEMNRHVGTVQKTSRMKASQ
jgi:predicted O-methyltransferase YrrM